MPAAAGRIFCGGRDAISWGVRGGRVAATPRRRAGASEGRSRGEGDASRATTPGVRQSRGAQEGDPLSPQVKACAHAACFWCTHRAMDSLAESHCHLCRAPFRHLGAVCEPLHLHVVRAFPEEAARRQADEALADAEGRGAAPPVSNAPVDLTCHNCYAPDAVYVGEPASGSRGAFTPCGAFLDILARFEPPRAGRELRPLALRRVQRARLRVRGEVRLSTAAALSVDLPRSGDRGAAGGRAALLRAGSAGAGTRRRGRDPRLRALWRGLRRVRGVSDPGDGVPVSRLPRRDGLRPVRRVQGVAETRGGRGPLRPGAPAGPPRRGAGPGHSAGVRIVSLSSAKKTRSPSGLMRAARWTAGAALVRTRGKGGRVYRPRFGRGCTTSRR